MDNGGHIRNGLPEYDGLTVFKANDPIIELLKDRGALMGRSEIHHSYPHCWRCHKPMIFRATEQWFIGMETPMEGPDGTATTFRQRAMDEIKQVKWDPAWGEERISNMIATRPDWCISRQRIWGVPIAVFLCQKCHKPLNDPAIHRSIVESVCKGGGGRLVYPRGCRSVCRREQHVRIAVRTEFKKEMDILDVWFESGASWHAVLEADPELSFPAGPVHRGRRSASRVVPLFPADVCRGHGKSALPDGRDLRLDAG